MLCKCLQNQYCTLAYLKHRHIILWNGCYHSFNLFETNTHSYLSMKYWETGDIKSYLKVNRQKGFSRFFIFEFCHFATFQDHSHRLNDIVTCACEVNNLKPHKPINWGHTLITSPKTWLLTLGQLKASWYGGPNREDRINRKQRTEFLTEGPNK